MQHRWLHPASRSCLLAAAVLGAVGLPAQQIQVQVQVQGQGQAVIRLPMLGPQGGAAAGADRGLPVEMFENPNLDRYLRRAQDFLGREDYAAAIQVLQDVVEGRTVEVVGPAEPTTPPEPTPPTETNAEARPAAPASNETLDARQAVFSGDGRLFRPVRRLCHELLAGLPDVGVELYRATHEVAAGELFERALAQGTVSALEEVGNRYFPTLAAGRAMVALADRLMHEGRYRAAVQVLHDLVQVYPAGNRARLGIDEVWCGFKAALCLRLAGETAAAHAAVVALAQRHPQATLRIAGELQAIADLPDGALFGGDVLETLAPVAAAPVPALRCIGADTAELVPMWQYRFADPAPYRDPKSGSDGNRTAVFGEGIRATAMPHAGRYGPATRVAFVPPADGAAAGEPAALFLEHFCLRIAGAETGLQLAAGDGPTLPPVPREGHPRVRIAAVDFALLRPIVDEQRVYTVIGHDRNSTSSIETLKSSELVAYDRSTWQRAWSSQQWREGENGLEDVTFLAAPTVFGERLLLPSLRRDVYELRCLDRATGRPLWRTPLHGGGSPFFKAPGTPIAVSGGNAYVLTNAGCVAAVDAFTGDLRWIRRYERIDPLRSRPQATRGHDGEQADFGYTAQFLETDLPGFLPNDLIAADGLVVLAAVDSDLLLGVDGATGEPVWMLDGTTQHAPYGKLREVVGATADALFCVADKALVCIELRGGLVRWCRDLPATGGRRSHGRGRGTIVGDLVLVPGDRAILAFDVRCERPMRNLQLPAFDASREPLEGSFDLSAYGPLLAIGYQGGIEVVSSREALRAAAAAASGLARRVELLVHAGDAEAAEAQVTAALRDGTLAAAERDPMAARLLRLVRARAQRLAAAGRLDDALAALDGIADLVAGRTLQQVWFLARLDACSEAGDLRAHEREQQRLYDFMEGRTAGGGR
ncbi:MAG: PQQ-binding-like beta-propeller repeat protein [Planctomycetes bacterium]|nr:PQQ-binding-like beta-propeller repeat protein [Planctomycetota bacterium]